ncbi:MAG: ABC transporter ATP-binding protein [Acidimicrobiales bacterium]|nr:ABC transporter ATP-binding protein [Hyphomonadaceae bacterium]RZV44979.1 MAG: ABC transporter ATP-binding protein [Acidimicrobiales bacterium]
MSLELRHISAGYGKTPVLENVHTRAAKGDFIGLVGPNGAGKSCLLKTIAGLIKPTEGELGLSGFDLSTFPAKARAKHIAYLAQERNAAWPLTVRELVTLGRAPFRGPLGDLSKAGESAIDQAITAVQCEDIMDRRFDHLSGGEQARVLLARALAVDAPVLLADEPVASLDPYYQLSIMQSLHAEAIRGKTVIASLHDLGLAQQFCSRIWVLDKGKLVRDDLAERALGAQILHEVFGVRRVTDGFALSGDAAADSVPPPPVQF